MNMTLDPDYDRSGCSQPPTSQLPILWIDGVGGYLLVDRSQASLGQAAAGNRVDIGIVADLSRQAGVVRRVDSDYLLQPLQLDTQVNGECVDRPRLLRHGDLIGFGPRVRLRFGKPHPLSATASLELSGCGRFQPHVDRVLLLHETCLIGPQAGSHVVCPQWQSEVLLVRRGAQWVIRSSQELEVNGRLQREPIALLSGLRIRGADFSLSIE